MTPTRRQFGATTVGVSVGAAGCLAGEPGTGFDGNEGDKDSDTDDDSDNQRSETTQQLIDNLDERGLAVQSTTTTDAAIRLTVQATGDTDRDIEIAASAFATLLNSEPAVDRDLRVRVEDRGLDQGRFRIEAAWARRFLSDDRSDTEYLALIDDTWHE